MITTLLLGRKGSSGFPGKNIYPVLGRPLAFYPMAAAINSKNAGNVFISTDDEDLMNPARKNNVEIIVRPPELCTKEALGEDAFVHGYKYIRDVFRKGVENPNYRPYSDENVNNFIKEVVYDGVKNRDVLEDYRKYILSISQKGIEV